MSSICVLQLLQRHSLVLYRCLDTLYSSLQVWLLWLSALAWCLVLLQLLRHRRFLIATNSELVELTALYDTQCVSPCSVVVILLRSHLTQSSDGGLILTSVGVAGLTDSASRAALSVLLIPLLHQQARNEERTLLEIYGSEYEKYSREVPSSVLPFVDVEILL